MTIRIAPTPPTAPPSEDLVRRTQAIVLKRPTQGRGRARRLLQAARLECQKGGGIIDGLQCSECRRFINAAPAADARSLEVRCLWSERDPIEYVMTLSPALVSVPPSASVSQAAARALYRHVKCLLVVKDGLLLGEICPCAIKDAAPSLLVGNQVNAISGSISPSASIAQVARAFTHFNGHCLPVVREQFLAGIVTRGDLQRLGIPLEVLGRDPVLPSATEAPA